MEVSPLEDVVLSGSRWRNFWSQSGSDWSAVWTHPELLPQVALINHANISLTLLCLSWQNPVLPALQSLGFTGWLNELLRGSFYCLLPLLNCRPVTTVQLWFPWSPNQAVRGLCLSSHWTEGPSPETSRAVSGLQVSSVCRILAVTLVLCINQTSCQDGVIISQRRVVSMGIVKPVSGLRVVLSPHIFIYRKKALVYFVR